MKKVIICGNYGATNIGDEAILDGIILLVRLADPHAKIVVMSANPVETEIAHKVKSVGLLPCGVRSFFKAIFGGGLGKTLDAIKNCDAVILGGGGLFSDEKMMAIVIWSIQNAFFRHYRKPVFCLGQSVGPLNTFFGRRMTKKVFGEAGLVTVRDSLSQKLLNSLNLPKSSVLADPAFVLPFREPYLEKREDYVVISVRPWIKGDSPALYKILAQFILWLYRDYGLRTILAPFQLNPDNDLTVLNNILVQVNEGKKKDEKVAEIYEFSENYGKIVELISKAKAVIGMRLHSLIFSVLTETPMMALSYSSKISAFMSDLELSDYSIDWEKITLEDLKARFKSLIQNYDNILLNLNEKQLMMRTKAKDHEKFLRTFFGLKTL